MVGGLWLRLVLFLAVAVAASFSFLRYLSWGFAYSAVLGLPSRAAQAQQAYYRGWFFLLMFIVLEIVLTSIWASYWKPADFDSAALRFVSRYGLGLVISVLVTAILVGVNIMLTRA